VCVLVPPLPPLSLWIYSILITTIISSIVFRLKKCVFLLYSHSRLCARWFHCTGSNFYYKNYDYAQVQWSTNRPPAFCLGISEILCHFLLNDPSLNWRSAMGIPFVCSRRRRFYDNGKSPVNGNQMKPRLGRKQVPFLPVKVQNQTESNLRSFLSKLIKFSKRISLFGTTSTFRKKKINFISWNSKCLCEWTHNEKTQGEGDDDPF